MIIIVVLLFPKLQVVTTVVERESQPWRMKRYKQVGIDSRKEANENHDVINTMSVYYMGNTTETKPTATDDKVECQKFRPETFFNGASLCKNKGFQFPTPSNLNKMKTSNGQFWIGARNTDGVWRDESNEEIDPIFPVGGNFGKISDVNDVCLYWDKNSIQKIACDQTKLVVCCSNASESVKELRTSTNSPAPTTTAISFSHPNITAISMATETSTIKMTNVAKEHEDDQRSIPLSFSCFDPKWVVFDDKTLIKIKVLDRTKCRGICQRINYCLAFSANETFCILKMSSNMENLQSVTAMLSVFMT